MADPDAPAEEPQGPQQPQQPSLQDLSNSITQAVGAAPELGTSPGAALTVAANGGNVRATGQTVAQLGTSAKVGQAAAKADGSSGGILGDVLGDFGRYVGHPLLDAVDNLSKASWAPTQFIQHEYRYLHDVEATHGALPAILEGLGIAAGAAGGYALGGGKPGAILGGEATAGLEALVFYHNSWDRTGNPNYVDPHTGQKVSFGRDVASGLMGLAPSSGTYKVMSGAMDGMFDLFLDPLGQAGDIAGSIHSAEGAEGILKARYGGLGIGEQMKPIIARELLSNTPDEVRALAPSITAEAVENGYRQYRGVRNAMQVLATMNAGDIVSFDPKLAPLAKELGDATDVDQVMDVFRNQAKAQEMVSPNLPSYSNAAIGFKRIRMMMEDAPISMKGGILNPLNLPGKVTKALTRIPGEALDPETLEFSGKQLDLVGQSGLRDLRNFLRLGKLKGSTVNQIVDAYTHADVGTRLLIFRNAVLDMIRSQAGLEYGQSLPGSVDDAMDSLNDPELRKKLGNMIDGMAPTDPAINGVYMSTIDGDVGSAVKDPETGREFGAAVLLSQRGKVMLPDYAELRRMAQEVSNAKFSHMLGGADDFLYQHVTNNFFKRWVLMSPSYAEHISFSEIVPNLLRNGWGMLAKGALGKVARIGVRIDSEDDVNKFEGWAYRLLQKSANKVDQHTMDRAAEFYVATDGNVATRAVSASHTYGGIEDPENALRKTGDDALAKRRGSKRGSIAWKQADTYTGYGPETARHTPNWQIWLAQLAKDPASRAAARTYRDLMGEGFSESTMDRAAASAAYKELGFYKQDEIESMLRSKVASRGAPDGTDPMKDWAAQIAANVKGATHSPTTRLGDRSLLDSIANKRVQTFSDRRLEKITMEDRPLRVPGRELIPAVKHLPAEIASQGYEKVINPIVNFLSRQPLALTEYIKARDALQPFVDLGIYNEDQALTIAMRQSTAEAMKYVHNIHDRTQLDELMRNVAPFFFAQEQAYRRAGRLLASDPGAFRRYQLMISGVHNLVNTLSDSNGDQYIAFPGSGYLGRLVPGMFGKLGIPVASLSPVGFGGTLSSANVVFPLSDGVRPNLGPVAMVPAQLLSGMFAELGQHNADFAPVANSAQGALSWAVGNIDMSDPLWNQLVPNETVARIIQGLNPNDTTFHSATLQIMQSLAYQQELALDKWIKDGQKGAAPDNILPGYLSANEMTELENTNTPAAQAVLQKMGNAQSPMTQQSFVDKVVNQTRILFMMRAIIGTVSPISSDLMVQNYGLPQALTDAINKAGNVTEGVTDFLAANPDATPYTTFQTTSTSGMTLPDSEQAMQWIDSNKQNISQYPEGYIWLMPQVSTQYNEQVYNEQIAYGLRQRDTPEQFLQQLYINAGNSVYYNALPAHEANVSAAGNSSGDLQAEYSRWSDFTNMLAAQMPVWAANFNSNAKVSTADSALKQLTEIYQNGQEGDGEQAQLVGQLLGDYQQYSQAYTAAGQTSDYSTAQKQVADQWTQYLASMAQQNPSLQAVINGVFKYALISSSTLVGAG